MRNFLLAFYLFLSLLSCNGSICPPDEKVGDLSLTDVTQSFNPYESGSRLVFISNLGDSLVFTANNGLETSIDNLCVREICTEPKIKGNTTCEFYESEANRLVFSTAEQDAVIDFLLVSDVVRRNTTSFYQFLQINISQSTFIEQASILTDSINISNLENENIEILNYLQFLGDLSLNGKSFQEVFAYQGSLLTIYYNKQLGIVGFKTPEAVWTIQ